MFKSQEQIAIDAAQDLKYQLNYYKDLVDTLLVRIQNVSIERDVLQVWKDEQITLIYAKKVTEEIEQEKILKNTLPEVPPAMVPISGYGYTPPAAYVQKERE